jgi:hypothetical protein
LTKGSNPDQHLTSGLIAASKLSKNLDLKYLLDL